MSQSKLHHASTSGLNTDTDESGEFSQSVSVVIPARNAAATLNAAVQSILAQQGIGDFELVIIDHASSDETPRLLKDFCKKHSCVKAARCEGSFVEAANLAWQMAEGDWIARMDADDVSHPQRIRQQRDFLQKNSRHRRLRNSGPDFEKRSGFTEKFLHRMRDMPSTKNGSIQ